MPVHQALFENAQVLEEDQILEEDPEALYPLDQYQDGKRFSSKLVYILTSLDGQLVYGHPIHPSGKKS